MTKKYSSFKEQQKLTENFRRFINEGSAYDNPGIPQLFAIDWIRANRNEVEDITGRGRRGQLGQGAVKAIQAFKDSGDTIDPRNPSWHDSSSNPIWKDKYDIDPANYGYGFKLDDILAKIRIAWDDDEIRKAWLEKAKTKKDGGSF